MTQLAIQTYDHLICGLRVDFEVGAGAFLGVALVFNPGVVGANRRRERGFFAQLERPRQANTGSGKAAAVIRFGGFAEATFATAGANKTSIFVPFSIPGAGLPNTLFIAADTEQAFTGPQVRLQHRSD